jgi:hypothetical protein
MQKPPWRFDGGERPGVELRQNAASPRMRNEFTAHAAPPLLAANSTAARQLFAMRRRRAAGERRSMAVRKRAAIAPE